MDACSGFETFYRGEDGLLSVKKMRFDGGVGIGNAYL